MSGAEKYRRILSALLPAGVLGMSILLGSAGANAALYVPADPQGSTKQQVGERLAAIRAGVSDVTALERNIGSALQGTDQIAWHNGWLNGGWRNGWKNWKNNWSNGWKNGGGGWGNGGGGGVWGNGGGGGWLNF